MDELTVTARGQVTFRKDVLRHLGIEPGQKIVLDRLPGGRIALKAQRPAGAITDFIGLLAAERRRLRRWKRSTGLLPQDGAATVPIRRDECYRRHQHSHSGGRAG